jgi:hypothetical protein
MVGLMLREPGREGERALLLLDVLVAHKDSSTDAAAHDIGSVLLHGAEPHVLIVLTEGFAEILSPWRFAAELSRRVYPRSEAYP